MGYALECEEEASRLEKQSKQKCYSIESELSNIQIHKDEKILDAGCGTGLLSRYIIDTYGKEFEVDACDGSETRIKQAQNLSKNYKINYFATQLEDIEKPTDYYTRIFSRYVFQHLMDPKIVAEELYRVTAPEGKIHIIETDGLFYNFHSANEKLNSTLKKLKESNDLGFDLFTGRKVPSILKSVGFKNISWSIDTMNFEGDELQMEHDNYVERFKIVYPAIEKVLGSSEATDFCNTFLSEMLKDDTVIFFNRIVITASK